MHKQERDALQKWTQCSKCEKWRKVVFAHQCNSEASALPAAPEQCASLIFPFAVQAFVLLCPRKENAKHIYVCNVAADMLCMLQMISNAQLIGTAEHFA